MNREGWLYFYFIRIFIVDLLINLDKTIDLIIGQIIFMEKAIIIGLLELFL